VDEVISELKSYKNDKATYLSVRNEQIDTRSDAEVAAWLIYLNKTGYNGIYRVNSKNLFNVPFGNNPRATICDEGNLRACSATLKHTEIHCEDFSAVLDRAREGDVVYFDPPYVPVSETAYFTSYTAGGFPMAEQVRLRDVALELKRRGVFVLLSNSSSNSVYDLYTGDFECIPVKASRLVNRDVHSRGHVIELLIA
jgi:DNA adenine methylase